MDEGMHQAQVELDTEARKTDEFGIEELWLKVREQGKMRAWIETRIFKTPMKLVWVKDLGVAHRERGKQYSSMLMRAIEQRMIDSGAIGFVLNYAGKFEDTSEKAEGMYERHLWIPLGTGSARVFNTSGKEDDESKIIEMVTRIQDQYNNHERDSEIS